jgi:adenylate cyclase
MAMTASQIADLEGRRVYQESLTMEILRSEFRRVTILLWLFVLLACVFCLFAFVPGFLGSEFRVGLRDQWPHVLTLFGAIILYESIARGAIQRLIANRRSPGAPLRFVNGFVEASIPTLFLYMTASVLGPRDALVAHSFLFYFLFILLSILQLDLRLCWFAGAVSAVEYFVIAAVALGLAGPDIPAGPITTLPFHFMRSLILFMTGVIAGLIAREIRNQHEVSLRAAQQRDQAVRTFGQYVSPQIAEKLLRQPVELGGELRKVCVLFMDIRNFSQYAAGESPQAVMAYLNTLFGAVVEVVNQHQGVVNKFLGDGFMAVFGAPMKDDESCRHGLDAAMDIIARVNTLNTTGKIPLTKIGIGLHTGEVMTGNIGSVERKEYTIIGDVVNVASRIEQATKEFQAQLLVSETVRESLGAASLTCEDLGLVPLKGQKQPVRVFKVV